MSRDPSAELRDLIAENEGKRRNGRASDGRGWYRSEADRQECYAIADAVMEMFPDVGEEWQNHYLVWIPGHKPRGGDFDTRFVLRTAPVPIKENN